MASATVRREKKAKPTRRSLVRHFDGDVYTKYLAWFYDAATKITGWKRKTARHALHGIKPGKMLDVGCGTGYLMNQARQMGFDVVGIDPSVGMITKAKKKFGYTDKQILQTTACKIPFPDHHFDFILATGALAYVPNMEEAAAEIARVTKKGGTIRIIDHTDPEEKNIFSAFVHLFTHASGDLIHDYEHYFGKHCKLGQRKTLGRGGYMQMFDFKKLD